MILFLLTTKRSIMASKELMTAYQANDHRVYCLRESGYIFERGGVVIIKHDIFDDDERNFRTLFTDVDGVVRGASDEHSDSLLVYDFIGLVGDKITPRDLSVAITGNLKSNSDCFYSVLEDAERYFVFDDGKAEDTIKIDLALVYGNNFRLDVDSDYYSFGDDLVFNLDAENFKSEDETYSLYEAVVAPLAYYCYYLKKPLNISIDFLNCTTPFPDEQMVVEENENINRVRVKYLDKIRRFIVDGVKEELISYNSHDNSKYDKYDDVNRDGKIIPLV